MTGDGSGLGEFIHESAAGQCAVVAALVIALHKDGILPLDKYTNVLHGLWTDMPEEVAVGEAGAVIERMLDLLSARAPRPRQRDNAQDRPEIAELANRPVKNGNTTAEVAPSRSKDLSCEPCLPVVRAWSGDRRDPFFLSESEVS